MSGFTFFKRGECPVCSGLRNDCRQSDTTGLIFCRETSANPTGYIYRKEDVHGFGLWQSSSDFDDFTQQNQEERERRHREYLAAKERRKQQQIQGQLSARERDTHYRAILKQLRLSDGDRQQLLTRGFTPKQIEQDGYKSVSKWQDVRNIYPSNLPGILGNGVLNIPSNGILCPISDKDGLIVGCQVRLAEATNGRYRWLTSATRKNPSGATPHLNGELPIAVFEPDGLKGDSIWISEGTSFKPSLLRHRLNVPVLGAASGRFNTSPEATKAAVEYLSNKYQTKILTFAIDAGDVANQDGVPERWLQQFEFFSKLGYEIRIAWWSQVDKSFRDIDELQPSEYTNIRYLSIAEFKDICFEWGGLTKSGTGFSHSKNNSKKTTVNNQSLDDDWKWNRWLRSRKFTPDRVVLQKEFTIDNIPVSGVIVGAKSGLGTGKTNFLIDQIKQSAINGKGSVILGYRNNLLLQTGERALKRKIAIYHIHQDDEARLMMPDESSNHMMCLDSIHHMDGYFKGRDIYLDETVSVLLHAVNGGTLGDGQAKALRIFKKALQDCDRIFLLDGNLADLYVKFIAKLAGNKRVIKVENTQKIPPHDIQIIDGIDDEGEIKKRDRSPLIQFLLKPDVKPWIFCDSKERTKVLYKLLTDLGKKGYVLNSETTGENWAKEFLADQDKFITENKPDFMLLSPSGDSGLSCTLKQYFTHKFSFFSGVLGTNSQHQSMFRLRDDGIPHYVFCPEFSTVRNRSNPKNYSANAIKDILNNRIVQSALLASDCSENPQQAIEVITSALNRNDPDWYGFSLEMTALDNYEMDNLRKCLIHALTEAGHNVEIAEWDIVGKVKEAEKKAKDEIQQVHSKEIFEAVEFKSIEEANKKAKASPNKATQRRIEKTWLLERLPGIQNTSVWSTQFIHQCHTTRRDFIKQQERYWLLKNYETSQKRHESIWNYAALGEDFFSRSVSAMGHDVIWALRELNLLSFTDTNILINKNSPEVIQLVKTLRERHDLQLALRISRLEPETVIGKERLRILNQLLEIIGFKTRCTGRKIIKTEEGTIRLRHYHVIPIEIHNVVQNSTASTPPHIYIDSQGCGRSQTPSINRDSSQFDLKAARQAILEAMEYKFTKWMNSDKSKVKWEVEAEEQPITQSPIPNPPSPIPHSEADIAAEKLRTIEDWSEVDLSQQELNEAWALLSEPEQVRLQKLFEEHQQRNYQPENISLLETAISSQSPVKEVGFGSQHFRQYQILRILENGIAWVREMWGDKQEYQMSISQLAI